MRKSLLGVLIVLAAVLAGCVTINVYFPKAAAEQAADQFIGSIIDQGKQGSQAQKGQPAAPASSPDKAQAKPLSMVLNLLIPAAHAADTLNLKVHTPKVDALRASMVQRYKSSLHALLDDGAVGYTRDGLVAIRSATAIPLSKRAVVNGVVANENRDRLALYKAIADANGHPEWAARIRQIFADWWIRKAHAGWYVQTDTGAWQKKK